MNRNKTVEQLKKEFALYHKKAKYDDYLHDEIIINERIASSELTPKGKYSKGYANTLKVLSGSLGTGSTLSRRERMDYVNNVFQRANNSKTKHPFNQGEIKAIMNLKKHNAKKGLNIYGVKIKNKRKGI